MDSKLGDKAKENVKTVGEVPGTGKDIGLPASLKPSEPKVTRIFDDIAIRDAVVHYPDDMMWVNGLEAKKLIFGVINDLSENVSVQPIARAGAAKGNLGSATTVNKGAEGVIPLDLRSYWAPWLGVSVTAASAPASGKLTIYAVWRED